jgi:hypothetical protein
MRPSPTARYKAVIADTAPESRLSAMVVFGTKANVRGGGAPTFRFGIERPAGG